MYPTGFKPLLASVADISKILFPVLCSKKLDGIRTIIFDGVAYSRNLKPIPNKHVQKWAAENASVLNNLDGEIIVGPDNASDVFRNTTSGVMKVEGEPDFHFYAFDNADPALKDRPYTERYAAIPKEWRVETYQVTNLAELASWEEKWNNDGYEGLMLRSLTGRYKWGRSSVPEGILLKVKRFVDDEAEIIGFEERLHNANEATTDLLGHTERSSHRENMVPMGTLGSLLCRTRSGVEFNLGSGFSDYERQLIWDSQSGFLGKLAKFRYQPVGEKDKPRFPTYLGIRERADL